MGKWSVKTQAFGTAIGIGMERAARAMFDFGKMSVAAFVAAEESQTKLADAFTRFPAIADTSVAKLQALNKTLMAKTKFDDDAFASGQAQLAQFKLTGKQIEQLTPLLADFAAKTGMDLPAAANVFGRAMLGQGRGLKAVGINFKDTGTSAGNFAQLVQGLNEKVGGFAEKQGKTAAGQAAILSNQFGELQETVGQKLLPVLMSLAKWGLATIGWIERNKEIVGPLAAVIGAVVVAQWAWNIAMAANPIGLIIIGVAALVAGIVFLATKTTFFQTIWRVAWGSIKAAAVAVWDWLKKLPGMIGDAFVKVAEFITLPFRTAFNAIARLWNNTVGKLSFTVPGWVPGLGGKGFSMPNIPTMHSGGIVPGPRGAEVLALLQAGERVSPAGQAGPQILEAHIHIGDEVVRVVRTELRESNRGLRRAVLAGAGAR